MVIEGYCVTVEGGWVHDTFSPRAELACRRLFLNSHVPGRPLPTIEEMRERWKDAEKQGFKCAKATLTIHEETTATPEPSVATQR